MTRSLTFMFLPHIMMAILWEVDKVDMVLSFHANLRAEQNLENFVFMITILNSYNCLRLLKKIVGLKCVLDQRLFLFSLGLGQSQSPSLGPKMNTKVVFNHDPPPPPTTLNFLTSSRHSRRLKLGCSFRRQIGGF